MIHLNSLMLLIVVGVIVAELVMYLRRRVRQAQTGTAQAGTTGGPTLPPGTPPRPGRSVAVVLMAVYSAFFFWLSFLIAALADEYCSSQRCHATVGWAGLMLLVTLVLISVTAIAGVLPRRTAGQRIRALVLGYAGPMLALVAYFVAISGQVPL